MSTNCIQCVVRCRTGVDLLCDECRARSSKLCQEVIDRTIAGMGIPREILEAPIQNATATEIKMRKGD